MSSDNCCPCLFWWKPNQGYSQIDEDDEEYELPCNNKKCTEAKALTPIPPPAPSPPKTPSVPTYIPITPQPTMMKNMDGSYTNNTPVIGNRTPMIVENNGNSPMQTPPPGGVNDSNIFRQIPDRRDSERDFDVDASVFKGSVVQQKFFNKSTYDPKYVWINLTARSLCLSEHTTKERRHKEANLSDITGVIAGPPEKYRASANNQGEPSINGDLCLSIKFVRGGGIDLQFATVEDRDMWYQTIIRLIAQERDYRRTSVANTSK